MPKYELDDLTKEAGAFETPCQTKEKFSANDTSRHLKVFKHGCQYIHVFGVSEWGFLQICSYVCAFLSLGNPYTSASIP